MHVFRWVDMFSFSEGRHKINCRDCVLKEAIIGKQCSMVRVIGLMRAILHIG